MAFENGYSYLTKSLIQVAPPNGMANMKNGVSAVGKEWVRTLELVLSRVLNTHGSMRNEHEYILTRFLFRATFLMINCQKVVRY